ncbi:AraC family transcriptional regulator [uncultured Arcticibacterium sp.]|uniref:helix-turn-helix domain-containing protein n=1 Tax=uncultured Arcticibacterium sp. TaxID=2173042 RepID=UPI0030FA5D7C
MAAVIPRKELLSTQKEVMRIEEEDGKRIMYREVCVKELLKDSYVGDCIRFNTVEVSKNDNAAYISGVDFTTNKFPFKPNTAISISSDEALIKIHFSLEGTYSYQPLTHIKYLVQIPENHCNMFYYPATEGREIYYEENTKAFELYVKPSVLKELLGAGYKRWLEKLEGAIKNSNTYLHWDKSTFIPPHIRNRILEVLQCPYKGEVRKRYIESSLTLLLIEFLLGRESIAVTKNRAKLPNSDYLALVKVETYIRKNLQKQLRIIDLAELAGFNATKLKRDFKKVYGLTIFKHITSLRMERAIKLITEEGVPIAQASYEVGFSHPQHFTTAFKRTMGYLPSQLKPMET